MSKPNFNLPDGDPNNDGLMCVRKHRWSLSGRHLVDWWVKSVGIDFTNQKLTVELYQVVKPNADNDVPSLEWAENLERKGVRFEQLLTLTTYDAMNEPIYSYHFRNPAIVKRSEAFHYGSEDIATDKLEIKFDEVKRVKR